MSATAATAGNSSGAFNPKVILAVIVAGALALLAYLVLSAFSPQLDRGNNGGAHSLSNSADGYTALKALTEQVGIPTSVNRSDDVVGGALLVLTPEANTSKDDIKKLIEHHSNSGPILIILPKWNSMKIPTRRGWVQRVGLVGYNVDSLVPTELFGTDLKFSDYTAPKSDDWSFSTSFPEDDRPIRFTLPSKYRTLVCDECEGVMPVPSGGALVAAAWPDDYPIFVLSDPDILNNYGLRDKVRGKAALQLVDRLLEYGEADRIVYDVTLNGIGAKKSILRVLFEPPFLAVTLCLLLAAVLAGWQAFNRFGPPSRRAREIALGKSALIANGAELMKQAGKDHHGAGIYARHVRDQLASGLKAPSGLEDEALNKWLDRFTPHGMKSFSQLMQEMIGASGAEDMVRIGREMSRWRKGVLREH